MSSNEYDGHPGPFIKSHVIPQGVSVTAAAKTLGVGRPALSNLLNGRASLSVEMASKIEKAFGYSAKSLLDIQNKLEADSAAGREISTASLPYVPPFLRAKANDITEWAGSISSRTRFAVFLRCLVHSTCDNISSIDFPGNDDGERPGWDGFVECEAGNPWVPAGTSGWEFGVTSDFSEKANGDYKKSIKAHSASERKSMTFVFVTPHRWKNKSKWEEKKRTEGNWGDVRVLDVSDLEQWLEQSLPAQTWFANETGVEYEGTLSLDRCWTKWNADCDPAFTRDIFEEAISTTGKKLADRLHDNSGTAARLAANSTEEGLAFLHVLFREGDQKLDSIRDRVIVFTKPGPLSKLAAKTSRFIPVVTTREVEKELSETSLRLGGIVIAPRTTEGVEADIILEPLSSEAFRTGLETMQISGDAADKLAMESGRSLTVLRRRLSASDAIRKPEWSNQSELTKYLFPFLLAGAWNTKNEADCIIIAQLVGVADYSLAERKFTELLNLHSSPVWAVGGFRGVVSKIDALYAIAGWITGDDIKRFFEVADLVLSERDPSLDLPEADRWAAHIYNKTRDISASLRDGIADSLALLAEHGKTLFFGRTGIDTEHLCSRVVTALLTPLDPDKLESQSSDLPVYAETAPDTLLSIIEDDLKQTEPVVFSLVRPVDSNLFSRNPRTGLLWALENLAWSPRHFPRVVKILAALSKIRLDDNWVNKPAETLRSFFRSWFPQTGASLQQRIAILTQLIADDPEAAWSICGSELDASPGAASANHKPRWRDYALGHSDGVTHKERYEFYSFCIESALCWPAYNSEILSDMIGFEDHMSDEHNQKLWEVVCDWGKSANDAERATLREKIRTTSRRTARRKKRENRDGENDARRSSLAKAAYDALEPRDLIQKFSWLFKQHWVPEAWDEIEDDVDYRQRDERIQSMRDSAVKEILEAKGFKGVLDLTLLGEACWVIGGCVGRTLVESQRQSEFVDFVLAEHRLKESFAARRLLGGLLAEIGDENSFGVLHQLNYDQNTLVDLYCLIPFTRATWEKALSFGDEFATTYWQCVLPNWMHHSEEDLKYATTLLLKHKRPIAAFDFIHLDLKSVPSDLLYQALLDMTTSKEERGVVQSMEAYSIKKAIELLTDRATHSQSELALLEFRYLGLYRHDAEEPINLEKEVSKYPNIFCDAVELAFKRDDGTSDKDDIENIDALAENAYRLLSALKRIPGSADDNSVDAEHLEEWIVEARRLAGQKGRRDIVDYQIGELLSHAITGEDSVWPCESVRAVLDRLMTDSLARGFYIGTINSRGVHFRARGGAQERELAAKYEGWASAIEYEHPNTATVLRQVSDSYLGQAEWEDNEAAIRKRLRY